MIKPVGLSNKLWINASNLRMTKMKEYSIILGKNLSIFFCYDVLFFILGSNIIIITLWKSNNQYCISKSNQRKSLAHYMICMNALTGK